jgi:predicted ATPase
VNLLVGPNGSGKTTFMNALKLVFGRSAENSQASMGNADSYETDPKQDRHEETKPWRIAARFAYPAHKDEGPLKPYLAFPGLQGEMHFGEESVTKPIGRWEFLPKDGGFLDLMPGWKSGGKDRVWYGIYNRGFAMGWPRRITSLNQEAFRVPAEVFKDERNQTSTHYLHSWEHIKKDAIEFLGIELPAKPQLLSGTGFICPACNRPEERQQLGQSLPDQHGKPLYLGSDGLAHFLFMIMELRKHPWPTTFIIEEPDVYLHPTLQKRFMQYTRKLSQEVQHQFFITTHSPYLLDHTQIEGLAEDLHIYRVEYGSTPPLQRVQATKDKWEVLQRLGHTPADVLQSNAVIWVEGPSDATYLTTWLNAYLQEGAAPIRQWLDYTFATFGGATLKYHEAHYVDALEKAQQDAFVQLLTINPNAAIIIDSDKDHPELKWFTDVKARIKKEFDQASRPCWILKCNTIEDYVPEAYKLHWNDLHADEQRSKPKRAKKYAEVTSGKPLKEIVNNYDEVRSEIARLHDKIRTWSGHNTAL